MAAATAMPICALAGHRVRNTFIDLPGGEASPMPSPLATAPARCAVPLKESLIAAAKECAKELFPAAPEAGVEAAGEEARIPRARPLQLNLGSIPEPGSSEASVEVSDAEHENLRYATGTPRSIPASPAASWDMCPTPTDTPHPNSYKPTLSLVDMIEGPSVEVQGQFESGDMVWQPTIFQPVYQEFPQEYCLVTPVDPQAVHSEVAVACMPFEAAPMMLTASASEPPPAPQEPPQLPPQLPGGLPEPPHPPAAPPGSLEETPTPPAPERPPQLPEEVASLQDTAPPPKEAPSPVCGDAAALDAEGAAPAAAETRTWAQRLKAGRPTSRPVR